jgi:hypothetical protein
MLFPFFYKFLFRHTGFKIPISKPYKKAVCAKVYANDAKDRVDDSGYKI